MTDANKIYNALMTVLSHDRFRLILLVIAILSCQMLRAESAALKGDSAYNKADYQTALRYYNEALTKEGSSTELYYNIGNAYYRLDNLGRAVLSYERALKIDPSNDQARDNLQFVKSKIKDRPEDDSSYLNNVHKKIISLMSPDMWAWVTLGIFVLLMALVALYIFTANVNLRKVGFFGGIVMLCVFVYTLVIAYNSANEVNKHETAVVIVPTSYLSSMPASKDKNQKVVPVHEGITITIIDSVATPEDPNSRMWYNVKINNATSAWVRGSDIERI